MSTLAVKQIRSSPIHDSYRFGTGPELVLQPGTLGWSAVDLEEPAVRHLWEQGRYEILHGVLTVMPAAFFRGGKSAFMLASSLRVYLDQLQVVSEFASEADIQIRDDIRVRADIAAVFGDDIQKFGALKFKAEDTDWRDHALIIPPTLAIESVSKGHEQHDRQTKRKWYAEFGVKHYWIVDPYSKSMECLLLNENRYVVEATGAGSDILTPTSMPGFSLPLQNIWGS